MFHDLDFVSSNVEINFSLGQKQTVLLMCCWQGQLFQNYPKSYYDHEGFLFFLENWKWIINPWSIGSQCIKGTDWERILSVPFMHCNPRDLGSMTHFRIFPEIRTLMLLMKIIMFILFVTNFFELFVAILQTIKSITTWKHRFAKLKWNGGKLRLRDGIC